MGPPSPYPGLIAVSLKELDLADPNRLDKEEAAGPAPTDPLDTQICPNCGKLCTTVGKMNKHIKE